MSGFGSFHIDVERARELPVRVEEARWQLTEQLRAVDGSAAARGAGHADAAQAIAAFGVGVREFIAELTTRLESDEGRLRQCAVNYQAADETSTAGADVLLRRLSPLPGKL